ncbi:MAG: VOC family protein [Acidimicrobiales bacterium]
MACSILNVTVDCADGERVARFWSDVTGLAWSRQDMPGNPFWIVGDPDSTTTRLVLVEVPEPKAVKNRVHVDLLPNEDSGEGEVERILGLGATIVDDRRDTTPGGWVVMADPEGNEFCVEQG